MAARSALMIVVVRDDALRHLLRARLAASGIALHDGHADSLGRTMIRQPLVILTGEAGLAGELGRQVEAGWLERRWGQVATLTVDAPLPAGERDWLLYASPAEALDRTLAGWGALPDNS